MKFCEVKTCRLESWGLEEYQRSGWVPVTDSTWRTISHHSQTATPTKVSRKRRGLIRFDPEQYEKLSKERVQLILECKLITI